MDRHAFTFGIEEEYFVVDLLTRQPPRRMPEAFFRAARAALGDHVGPELLQAQIEVRTPVCRNPAICASTLRELRSTLAELARVHGLGLVAAGTSPLADWREQLHTRKPRYDQMMVDLQITGQRNLVCGLHVHVELPDPETRVDVMRRTQPFLPPLLALSTSSPFWRRRHTGLMSYRLTSYGEIPRTGLPPLFRDTADYTRYLATLTGSGLIPDASYVWWALRPSGKYPTLELRACDMCTRVDDSLAIAQLYRCLLRMLVRRPDRFAALAASGQALVAENLWRAQRHGLDEAFLDLDTRALVPARALLAGIREAVAEDAAALQAEAELAHLDTILARGTSAHAQRALFKQRIEAGATPQEAMSAVVDWLVQETAACDAPPQ